MHLCWFVVGLQLNIQFDEHNCFTYEYPSEQSLMASMSPQPGHYDYVDTSLPNGGSGDSGVTSPRGDDTDTDDDSPRPLAQPAPSSKSLKSTPAVGSTGRSVAVAPRFRLDVVLILKKVFWFIETRITAYNICPVTGTFTNNLNRVRKF